MTASVSIVGGAQRGLSCPAMLWRGMSGELVTRVCARVVVAICNFLSHVVERGVD